MIDFNKAFPDEKGFAGIYQRYVIARLPELEKARKRARRVEFFQTDGGKALVVISFFPVFITAGFGAALLLAILPLKDVVPPPHDNLVAVGLLAAAGFFSLYYYYRFLSRFIGFKGVRAYREGVADLILEAVTTQLSLAPATDRMDAFTRAGFDFPNQTDQTRYWFRGTHRDLDYEIAFVFDWKQAKEYHLQSIPLDLDLDGSVFLVAGEEFLSKPLAAMINGKPGIVRGQIFVNGGLTVYGDDQAATQSVLQEVPVRRLAALPQILDQSSFLMILDGQHLLLITDSGFADHLAKARIKDLPSKLDEFCGNALFVGRCPRLIIDHIEDPSRQSPDSAAAFFEQSPEETGFAEIFQQSVIGHLPGLEVWTKKIKRLRWLKKPMLWFWISLAIFVIPPLLAAKYFSWFEDTRNLVNILIGVAGAVAIIVTVFLGRFFMKPVQRYKKALLNLVTGAIGDFLPEIRSHGEPTDEPSFLSEMSDLGLIYKAKPYRLIHEFRGRHRGAGFQTTLMVHPSDPGEWVRGEENDFLFAVVAIDYPTAVTAPLVLVKRHRQMPIHIQNRFPSKHRVAPPEPLTEAGFSAFSADPFNAEMVLADPKLEKLAALPRIVDRKVLTIVLDGRRLLILSGTLAEFTILPVPASLYFVQKLVREALHDGMKPRAIIDALA